MLVLVYGPAISSDDAKLEDELSEELKRGTRGLATYHVRDPSVELSDEALLAKLRKRTTVYRVFVRCSLEEAVENKLDFGQVLAYYDRIAAWQRRNPPDHVFLSNHEFMTHSMQSLVRSFRPSWKDYFMRLAYFVSLRSNCLKRRVGAALVREKRVIATGYNGTPSGAMNCVEGGCERCSEHTNVQGVALDICECIHAEVNALLEVGRCPGAAMFVTLMPCLACSKLIVQVGVTHLYYCDSYDHQRSAALLQKHNIIVEQVVVHELGQPTLPRAIEVS